MICYDEETIETGMRRAYWFAESSHDPDTKTGCAIFRRGMQIAGASNRIPPRITVTPERTARPEKYNWIEHCERRAIYSFYGNLTEFQDATMYLNWFPCADCARAIVAVGITKLVYVAKGDRKNDPRYGFDKSWEILQAGGVRLVEYKKEQQ